MTAPPDQPLPAGMVRVLVQNLSAAPLDVFLDKGDGSDPEWVMTIEAGYQIQQGSNVGQTWRLAQNDEWMGGFVPSAEPLQSVTFTGQRL